MENLNQKNKNLDELLYTENNNLIVFENKVKYLEVEYKSFSDIINAHKLAIKNISDRELELDKKLKEINEIVRDTTECDKWDYIFASSVGVLAGLVDSFFVGSPKDSKWLSSADSVMDSLVQKFAKLNG